MAKKKVAAKPRKKIVRMKPKAKKEYPPLPVGNPYPQAPVGYNYNPPPPYPLPTSYQVDIKNLSPDEIAAMSNPKSLYKSKEFWAAICMFCLSGLTVLGTFPVVASSPIFMGVTGLAFSVLWILLRTFTNQPVTPALNFPNPKDWLFKKK